MKMIENVEKLCYNNGKVWRHQQADDGMGYVWKKQHNESSDGFEINGRSWRNRTSVIAVGGLLLGDARLD
jgi:hypothetical protein